jgi:all-trans-8'-apo-beta-carotenal 15,15'-oxygenase
MSVRMGRRNFLAGASLMAIFSGSPLTRARAATEMEVRAERFAAALEEKPWLLGYQSAGMLRFQAGPGDIKVDGRIPDQLNGTLYRNGPGGHEVAGHRYAHWFDGDGMLHAFDLRGGRVSHRGRMLNTPKRRAEDDAGRPLFDGFGTRVPRPRALRGPDDINTANINVLLHGGRLMALWEGGSPAEIDPQSLEFRDFVTFSPETSGLPFSAHTRTDTDGTLWSIGYAGYAGKIILYRIGSDGKLAGVKLLDVSPTPMLHDFMVTERYLVLIMPPWLYEADKGGSFMQRHIWRPELGGRAVIIDKNTLETVRQIELPAFWAFHYSNAWEDGGGNIRFDFPRYADPELARDGFARIMDGDWPTGETPGYMMATLNIADGSYREERAFEGAAAEFPRISAGMTGRRHERTLLCRAGIGGNPAHPGFTETAMFYPSTGRIDSFRHGPPEMAEEAVFASATDGSEWVLQTVLDFNDAATRLKIFPAGDLAGGPAAVATLPYFVPLGLHGLYVT